LLQRTGNQAGVPDTFLFQPGKLYPPFALTNIIVRSNYNVKNIAKNAACLP